MIVLINNVCASTFPRLPLPECGRVVIRMVTTKPPIPATVHPTPAPMVARLLFYQTRSAWSMDQGSTRKRSAVHNCVPTVTKCCVMWEGLSLPHDTKFGNCRGEIVDRSVIFIKLIWFDKSGARSLRTCATDSNKGDASRNRHLEYARVGRSGKIQKVDFILCWTYIISYNSMLPIQVLG